MPPGQLCEVKVPKSVRLGQNFTVRFEDSQFTLTSTVPGGSTMRFVVPEYFQVVLPDVSAGQDFFVDLDGERYTMTCPRHVRPGQHVRFRRPLHKSEYLKSSQVSLKYGKQWSRVVNKKSKKFQWKLGDKNLPTEVSFAMVRDLVLYKNDFYYGHTEGTLEFKHPNAVTTECRVRGNHNEIAATSSELHSFRKTDFATKKLWVSSICQNITRDSNLGFMQFSVQRRAPYVLDRAVDSLMSLNNVDLRKQWNFELVGDGEAFENDSAQWFLEASKAALNHKGLFYETTCGTFDIHPDSKTKVQDYLVYYRFFGRLLGRAIFDGRQIAGRLDTYLLKHILGLPLTMADLEAIDAKWKQGFMIVLDYVEKGKDLEQLNLTFTVEGVNDTIIPLKENGENIQVTKDNHMEFIELLFEYKLVKNIRPQLTQILLGLFEIIPEPLLSVFDETELDALLSGSKDNEGGRSRVDAFNKVIPVARETGSAAVVARQ